MSRSGGYSRTEAAAALRQQNARVEAQRLREQRETYSAERAEARALGQEFPGFDEWRGVVSSRELAEQRLARDPESDDYE